MKCSLCRKKVGKNPPVRLPAGCDLPGIWFGFLAGGGNFLWFEDQVFCSLKCFISYLRQFCRENLKEK